MKEAIKSHVLVWNDWLWSWTSLGNSETTNCDCLVSVAHVNEGKAYQVCLHDDNYNICQKVGNSDTWTFCLNIISQLRGLSIYFSFKTLRRRKSILILNNSIYLLLKLPIQYQQKRPYTLTMLQTNKKNQNKKTDVLRLFH